MSFATSVLQTMLQSAQQEPPGADDDCDVHLLVGNDPHAPGEALMILRAHRIILAAVSPVFHGWFRADSAVRAHNESQNTDEAPEVPPSSKRPLIIYLPDFPPETVSLALNIIYGGTSLDTDSWIIAGQCWDFATRFGISHLRDLCQRKVLQMLDHSNALRLLEFALSNNDERSIDHIADFITAHDNFVALIRSDDFLLVNGTVLDALTNRPGPGSIVEGENTTVEKAWFDALISWLTVPSMQQEDQLASDDTKQNLTGERSSQPPRPKRPRMRHVDHVLGLVDLNRMKTEEIAAIAENVTACHAAYFPNCLIPLLAERTMILEQERESREEEVRKLSDSFRSAVFAKNEAERRETVLMSRVEKTKAEAKKLRETLNAKVMQSESPLSANVPFRSPSTSPVDDGFVDPALDPPGGSSANHHQRHQRRANPDVLADPRDVDTRIRHQSQLSSHSSSEVNQEKHRKYHESQSKRDGNRPRRSQHHGRKQDSSAKEFVDKYEELRISTQNGGPQDAEDQIEAATGQTYLRGDAILPEEDTLISSVQAADQDSPNNTQSRSDASQQKDSTQVHGSTKSRQKAPYYGESASDSYQVMRAWERRELRSHANGPPIHASPTKRTVFHRTATGRATYERSRMANPVPRLTYFPPYSEFQDPPNMEFRFPPGPQLY